MLHSHPSYALIYLLPFAAAMVMWVIYNFRARHFKRTLKAQKPDLYARLVADADIADLGIFHTVARCTVCKQQEVIDGVESVLQNEKQLTPELLSQLEMFRELYLWSVYVIFGGIAIVYAIGWL